ncbi:MAG TPA: metal ABC transporter permease [Verrucomicrobiae bacterium]|nr:metal ABC transporter permease [Verrucomicrobiae bacterium]
MMDWWHALVGGLPFEWARYAFMRNALFAIIIVSPLFSLMGALVVSQRLAFYSDAVGHSALAGLAIGLLLGMVDPFWAMIVFSAVFGLAIFGLKRWSAVPVDTVIGLLMSFAVALGVLLLSRGGNFMKVGHFLVGDLLSITSEQIARLLLLMVPATFLVLRSFNALTLASLSPSLAASRGFRIGREEVIFGLLVALAVTLNLQWVGILIINSLLILPAAAARNIARNLREYVGFAMANGLVCSVAGLLLAYYLGTSAGATIVLVAMGVFVVTALARLARK